MSIYWNEKTRQLKPYIPGEQPKDREFIKLNTNENPYPPSPMAIEAIKKAAADTLRLYPDPASAELRKAAAEIYGLKMTEVFPGNGSDEVLAFAFASFFSDGLLFPDITYSFYPVYADLWNIPYREIPLGENFSIDAEDYLGKSGGIIFPNPNAPTGIALPIDRIRKIAESAKQNGQVFIVDEAYAAFASDNASAMPLVKEFPNLLVVRTLSKESSLAGLRIGFAFGNEELIEGLYRVRNSFNSYTIDRLAEAGATAALKDASYYSEINRRITATRSRVSSNLETLGFRVLPSEANFVFASPPESCLKNAAEFYRALKERGILVRHFEKPRIANFLRISIGRDDHMDIFLEECRKILEEQAN